jgi:hypothetical protein
MSTAIQSRALRKHTTATDWAIQRFKLFITGRRNMWGKCASVEDIERLFRALELAVSIREYDRIDEENVFGVAVPVTHVTNRRVREISSIEHFYNGDCMRITFNEDENDFVDAYFTLDIAHAAAAGLVHKTSQT